jgi:hypothetical protein
METVSDALPYVRQNLRRNPFGELDLETRAALAVADVEELVALLGTPGRVIQLLGGSGRGKTTLLLAIRDRFPGAPYLKIREGERAKIPQSHPLFVDDVQLLPARQRKRLFGRRISFVVCTHEDLSVELESYGLRVTCIRPAERLSPEALEQAFRRRIEAARRGLGPVPWVSRDTVESLIRRHGEDVRAMELALYEGVQRLREVRDVQV